MTMAATARVGPVTRARASVTAIETLARIREQRRTVATDGDRVALSGWSGWGPLAKAFAPDDHTWADLAERIKQALPPDDVQLGLEGTHMAFYTPPDLVTAMWQALREFGYAGGPVAELGCGGGAFLSGAPEGTQLVGVERDPTAAAICQLLHPNAKVITGPLENTHLPARFAAVIGNVPFGRVRVFDPLAPAEVTDSLHNYFIWRAVQALTPGGYAMLLTSRFTMDSSGFAARSAIGKSADFVGAVRLPNGALGGGTEATCDLVILRRHGGTDTATYSQSWGDTAAAPFSDFTRINKWWTEEPDAVLGRMQQGPTTQYGLSVLVENDSDRPVAERLLGYVRDQLAPMAQARNLLWTPPLDPAAFDAHEAGVMTKEGWIDGTMKLTGDGGVLIVKDGRAHPLPSPKAELVALLKLRDLAVALVGAEAH